MRSSKRINQRLFGAGGFLDGHRVLAHAVAQVVQRGTADLAALGHLDLGNQRAVNWIDPFHAFAVAQLADGDGLALGEAALADDDAGKNLDTLLAAFDDALMDLDGIADIHVNEVGFHLLAVDLLEDIHGGLAYRLKNPPWEQAGCPGTGGRN